MILQWMAVTPTGIGRVMIYLIEWFIDYDTRDSYFCCIMILSV